MEQDNLIARVQESFQRELNKHGYGFQYAVINRAQYLYNNNWSIWRPAVAEIPVDQGPGTRVDLILQSQMYGSAAFLVGECKRVNPAFSDWCFVSAPFTHERRGRNSERMSFECLKYDPLEPIDNPPVHIEQRDGLYLDKAYHIGLEIKGGQKGDAHPTSGGGSDAIESAASQVLRGSNGLVNTLVMFPDMLAFKMVNVVMPVVFTTAQLWVSDADLSKTDLATGNLSLENYAFEKADWLFYQSHTSIGLKHPHIIEREIVASFEGLMDSQYVRTVAMVGKGGLDKFLRWSSERNFLSRFD